MYILHISVEVQEAFNIFDKNLDGTISIKELREAMKQTGHDATEEMVKNMLKSHDKDGTLAMRTMHMFIYSFVCLSVCLSFNPFVYFLSETAKVAGGCAVPGEIIPRRPYDVKILRKWKILCAEKMS